ncbi:MAG: tetratricopeptide repeat protein [Betaproteobacteria bacterium]
MMQPPSSRNAPCPCGSGRRYKECHGALEPAGLTNAAQSDPRKLIEQALAAVSRNDLAAAEHAARAVASTDPRHPDAAHVLGMVALARGEFATALEAADRAIAVLPDHASFHVTRARALLGALRPADAEQSARHALALAGDDASAWTMLGRALHSATGTAASAPDGPPAARDDMAAAEAAWKTALSHDPTDAEALFYLGNAARDRGDQKEAIRIYEDALKHHPGDAPLLNNLGLALERSGDVDAARKRYEEALQAPGAPTEAHANLARLLQVQQDYPGAAAHYHAYTTAVDDPSADVWANLALSQHKLGAFEAAEDSYRKALRRAPEDGNIKYGLAALLVELGRSTDAIPLLDQLRKTVRSGRVLHALLCARQLICDWTDWRATFDELRAHVARLPDVPGDSLIPFNALALPLSPAELLIVARRFAETYRDAQTLHLPRRGPRDRATRLKIGYVSADLRTHPIAYLLTELWERHDRERFEVYAYSIGPRDDGPLRQRIERAFEHFVDAADESANETARRIRADGIDILIDLNGYTSGSRMEIFIPKPAPVQMHWLGFLGTQGADWFDHILVDRIVAPPEMQPFFTERFLYLDGGYSPSDTRRVIDSQSQTRAAQGLPDGAPVFCCFNNAYKILPPVFDVWMRILAAVPGSVLWLSPSSEATCANLRREAGQRGIAPQRLIFAPRVELGTYLARLRLADLFLDTWPYNAGTTANDALFVGLPILTCAGETLVSRVAASQLLTLGVPELVTFDFATFERRAIELARAPDRLRALSERILERRTTSPLFDMERYTRRFEDTLDAAWRDYERTSPTATS